MFRLFLINLLKSGRDAEAMMDRPKNVLPPKRLRNRRIYERFDIDHKHLSLMNDQDILLVRDLSEKGFSTEVSPRGFKRLVVGDIYLCRIRYLGELYDAQACVRWKSKGFVGFELLKASKNTKTFMRRLIKPIEVGTSLQKMDDRFIEFHDNEGMTWYHGPNETNFYLWLDDEEEIRSWKLENSDQFIKWDPVSGVVTGTIVRDKQDSKALTPWSTTLKEDKIPNKDLKQFATDVFMVLQLPTKDKLIESVMS